jgi:hypothetical protein
VHDERMKGKKKKKFTTRNADLLFVVIVVGG